MKYSYYPGCAQHGTAVDYRMSVEAVMSRLGIELEENKNWNCCGALHVDDRSTRVALSARTLAAAKGLDLYRFTFSPIHVLLIPKVLFSCRGYSSLQRNFIKNLTDADFWKCRGENQNCSGLDVATPCNLCYSNLMRANTAFEDSDLKNRVNGALATKYEGNAKPKHLVPADKFISKAGW